MEITQERANQFAEEATGDHQWIHVGSAPRPRARSASDRPRRCLTLLGLVLMPQVVITTGFRMGANYGNKVCASCRRCRWAPSCAWASRSSASRTSPAVQVTYGFTFECGAPSRAGVAEVIFRSRSAAASAARASRPMPGHLARASPRSPPECQPPT
ncbi:MAG: hypothetical protein R2713_18530 [Ilumatobacteraceae bacterium]